MKRIDIKAIIKKYGLRKSDLAEELFPKNKHSRLALNRVIAGKGFLDERQIVKLSLLIGVSIESLFSSSAWKQVTKGPYWVFTKGDYSAAFNIDNGITTIFHKDSLVQKNILSDRAIPISEYLAALEKAIEDYEFKKAEARMTKPKARKPLNNRLDDLKKRMQ